MREIINLIEGLNKSYNSGSQNMSDESVIIAAIKNSFYFEPFQLSDDDIEVYGSKITIRIPNEAFGEWDIDRASFNEMETSIEAHGMVVSYQRMHLATSENYVVLYFTYH